MEIAKFEIENLRAAIRPTKLRLAVTKVEETFDGIFVMPQNKVQQYKLGNVVSVGSEVSVGIKEDDIILYQVNQMFESSVTHLINETPVLFMHQGDAIGKLSSRTVSLEEFQILGDWLLLRELSIDKVGDLFLPQSAIPPPEFRVIGVGSTVHKDEDPVIANIKIGDEIYVDRSRLGQVRLGSKTYFYMPKGFIHGVKPGV